MDLNSLKVWLLLDGKAGHDNQSRGLADALGVDAEEVLLEPTRWQRLWEHLHIPCAYKNLPQGDWPDVCIATGSHNALVNKWIKRKNSGTFTVQIMPRGGAESYDVAVALAHDKPKLARNQIVALAAPNTINSVKLLHEVESFKSLKDMEKPRFVLLVGGSNKKIDFDEKSATDLAAQVMKVVDAHGGSLMVTASRRTGEKQEKILRKACENLPPEKVFFWDGEGRNPYHAMLGVADYVIVTADSFSMVSEVATAGKPILLFGRKEGWNIGKFKSFYNELEAQGRLVDLANADGGIPSCSVPLAENQRIAGFVRAALVKRFGG